MFRNSLLTPALGVLCLFCISTLARPAAAEDYAAYAPADAYFFVSVSDMSAMRAAFPKTALGKVWADPEMAATAAEVSKNFWEDIDPELEEAGLKREDLEKLLPGQIAFWAESLDEYKPNEYGFVMVADRKEPAERYIQLLESAVEKSADVSIQKSRESKGGMDVYAMHWDMAPKMDAETLAGPMGKFTKHSLLYAFPEGKAIVVWDGDESIDRMMRRKEKGEGALASVEDFKSLTKNGDPTQARFYLPLGQTMRTFIDAQKNVDPMNGPSMDFEALGVYDIKDFAYEFHIGAEAIEFSSRINVESNPRGVAKALVSEAPLDPASLRAVPEKPLGFSALGIDFNAAASEVLKAARLASPQTGQMIGIMLAGAQAQIGVSVEGEMLPALGDQFVTALVEKPGAEQEPDRVYIVSLKTPEPFIKALTAFNEKVQPGSIEHGEAFLGAQIFNFKGYDYADESETPALKTVSTLGLSDRYAVFSQNADLARETLRRLAGKDEHNYFDAKKFNPPASASDRQLCSISRTDVGGLAKMLVEMLEEQSRWEKAFAAQGQEVAETPPLPPKALFDRYLGVFEETTWMTGSGLVSEGRLPHVPQAK